MRVQPQALTRSAFPAIYKIIIQVSIQVILPYRFQQIVKAVTHQVLIGNQHHLRYTIIFISCQVHTQRLIVILATMEIIIQHLIFVSVVIQIIITVQQIHLIHQQDFQQSAKPVIHKQHGFLQRSTMIINSSRFIQGSIGKSGALVRIVILILQTFQFFHA